MKRVRCEEEKEERWIIVINKFDGETTSNILIAGVRESSLDEPKTDNPKWDYETKTWYEPWVLIDDVTKFTEEHTCTVRIKHN